MPVLQVPLLSIKWTRNLRADGTSDWCRASLQEVRANMASTNYAESLLGYVVGDVWETLPDGSSEPIAILRLDTDWYASTRHELEQLYPQLSPGGVLIVDDYGYWKGARRVTDEYLANLPEPILLQRIDHTGRCAFKPYPTRSG